MCISTKARTLIGTPFVLCGRSETDGLDCYGLLVVTLNACGIPLRDRTAYQKHNDNLPWASALIAEVCDPVPTKDRRPSDILVFRRWGQPQGNFSFHAGILVSNSPSLVSKKLGRGQGWGNPTSLSKKLGRLLPFPRGSAPEAQWGCIQGVQGWGNPETFVNASDAARSVVEWDLDARWLDCLHAVWRPRGVDLTEAAER